MKKSISLLLALVMMISLVGCVSKDNEEPSQTVDVPVNTEVSNQETVEPEPVVSETPTPEIIESVTPETDSSGFKTMNVEGLFDIEVIDPLPEQMELSIFAAKDLTSGGISFDVVSSNPNCTPEHECSMNLYGFAWYTKEALEEMRNYIPIYDEDLICSYDTSVGTIYIYREYTYNLNNTILDGSYPDYVNEDFSLDYAIEDLIHWK